MCLGWIPGCGFCSPGNLTLRSHPGSEEEWGPMSEEAAAAASWIRSNECVNLCNNEVIGRFVEGSDSMQTVFGSDIKTFVEWLWCSAPVLSHIRKRLQTSCCVEVNKSVLWNQCLLNVWNKITVKNMWTSFLLKVTNLLQTFSLPDSFYSKHSIMSSCY